MNPIKRIAPYNKFTVAVVVPLIAQLLGAVFMLTPEVSDALSILIGAVAVLFVPNKTG